MARYTVRRLLQMVLILWVISVITFFLFWATPANPALLICGKDCTTERIAEVNPNGRMLGSEGTERQCSWPCFDESLQNGVQVSESLSAAIVPTIWLATGAAVIWLVVGG